MSAMPALGETVKPPEAVGSRDEIQNALQWLVRMARSFGPGASSGGDEGVLSFDPDGRRFLTPEIAPSTRLELRLPDIVLQFEENGRPSPHAMDVDDKSSTEIEAWLLIEMLHRDFDRDRFSKALPYPSEHLLSGDERKYAPNSHPAELQAHTDRLVAASRTLLNLRDAEAGPGADDPSHELLCWPQHMEVGFIARGADGAVDLEVGYRLGDGSDGMSSIFFVRPHSKTSSAIAPKTIPADDGVHAERLSSMIEAVRAAAAP